MSGISLGISRDEEGTQRSHTKSPKGKEAEVDYLTGTPHMGNGSQSREI